jgi:uroporphyrinogen decarboxylase
MPLLGQFIEAGVDGYQSIQTTCAMSIQSIAKEYGDKLCIWGAMPLETLIQLEPHDVKKAVRKCCEEAKLAKGFIFGPSHSIAYGTKYENFMTMLDEFEKCR